MRTLETDEAAAERWDAIVVGTGVGGATLGHALARAGWRVLFCEKGRARGVGEHVGDYAESFFAAPAYPSPEHADTLRRAGRWAEEIEDASTSRRRRFVPFIGSGVGGSSALYGMAMERFFPSDFEPGRTHAAGTGADLPADWPIAYEELAPFYAAAERLYRVRGTADPLRADRPELLPAPPLTRAGAGLARHFESHGLHPYRLPSACEYVDGCRSCQGFLCPNDCKNDSVRVCLRPAIEEYGAALLDECEAVRLIASRRTVDAIECRLGDRLVTLRARMVFVAAGALATPALFLRSASETWPAGLANESGLVGRNLMRHLVDLYAVEVNDAGESDNRVKEVAMNDFYERDGLKLGTVQSFGRFPPLDVVMQALLNDVRESAFAWAVPFVRLGAPLVRPELVKLIERRFTLATTLEDLPYAHNRVELAAGAQDRIALSYRPGGYELDRATRFRALVKEALAPLRFRFIAQADKNERIAHACGTCRFGDNPRASVLDRNCRAHGLDNLYVVDSAFFPTSGGTNPSLTIAANALRVATAVGAAGPA
jgi:choline dehydrogenase-like flavoprotein